MQFPHYLLTKSLRLPYKRLVEMNTVYPHPIENRPELNLRQGIKSSLPEIRQLIGLTIAIYIANRQSVVDYGLVNDQKIVFSDAQIDQLKTIFEKQLETSILSADKFVQILNSNPLITAQMEPLQVALELYLKLCKISFPDGSSSSKERTGGVRYPKRISFTTNLEIIRLCIEDEELRSILFYWITDINSVDGSQLLYKPDIAERLSHLLTIFGEETQFKIRTSEDREIFFQQEGIYQSVEQGNKVEDRDAREDVGPFRIFKRFVSVGLHPYIQNINGFTTRPHDSWPDLATYRQLVKAHLDVIPKRTTITILEEKNDSDLVQIMSPVHPLPDIPRNRILFGPPGTGKSSRIKKEYANTDKYSGLKKQRVTFHPDYEYGAFVGSYKPISVEVEGRKEIQYNYVAQEFIRIYTNAWNDPEHPHFLIIEEINRGNCAQIFGDLFQSLDRNTEHFSEYEVDTDTDLANHLTTFFKDNSVAAGRLSDQLSKHGCPADAYSKIILPDNLYIYATMNTSDQSLFPMDSAFKRRWDWEYVPIDYKPTDDNGTLIDFTIDLGGVGMYSWSAFIERANRFIRDGGHSEDKQLGFWFVKPTLSSQISQADFKSKVLFYLWFEVFRNEQNNSIFPNTIPVGATSDTESFVYGHLFDSNHEAAILQFIIEKLKLESIGPITE